MAAPETATVHKLDGKWKMNKELTDDFDGVLAFQGIGWLTRKAIGLATITLDIKQHKDDQGIEHIDIEQFATGGIKATPEHRQVDWKLRPHTDGVFGDLEGRTRFVKSSQLEGGLGKEDVAYLGEGWLEDEQIQSWVENKKSGWVANQIWGFQLVNGERRYVRKVVVTKEGAKKQACLVYDFTSP